MAKRMLLGVDIAQGKAMQLEQLVQMYEIVALGPHIESISKRGVVEAAVACKCGQ
jgi:hypothetical protein